MFAEDGHLRERHAVPFLGLEKEQKLPCHFSG
jgi:hypothetical protein